MAEFRFIHCADLHLGSRFAGFASRDSVLAEKLAQSPWEALKRLVNRAVADKVDFVTIGGDVFEEFSPPLPVWQKFLSFMEKLSDAGIEVFICTGNHDPLDSAWKYASSLPEKVKLFPAGAVFHPVEKADSTIAYVGGISYQSASAPADYASRIIEAVPDDDIPKFALLHTEVDGSAVSPYAPVPLAAIEETDERTVLTAVSDLQKDVTLNLTVNFRTFDGTVVKSEQRSAVLPAGDFAK